VSSNGACFTLNVPRATTTEARGINDAGEVVGHTEDAAGQPTGFTEAGGVTAALFVPAISLIVALLNLLEFQ